MFWFCSLHTEKASQCPSAVAGDVWESSGASMGSVHCCPWHCSSRHRPGFTWLLLIHSQNIDRKTAVPISSSVSSSFTFPNFPHLSHLNVFFNCQCTCSEHLWLSLTNRSAPVFPTCAVLSYFIFCRFCLLSWKGRMNSLLSKLWKRTWC